MKTKIVIEVETTKEQYDGILPEEGTTEADYTSEELIEFRHEFEKNIHEAIKSVITEYVKKEGQMEDDFLEEEETYVDGWDELEKYATVKVVEE